MGTLKVFDLEGKYPNGKPTGFLAPANLFDQLNEHYQNLANFHLQNGRMNGKFQKTVWIEFRAVINFYKHLQDNDAKTLADITPKMIHSFFHDGNRQIRGAHYCHLIKAAMKVLIMGHENRAKTIMSYLPAIKCGNKNFQYLSPEESAHIRECIEDHQNKLTTGERTIGRLLYFYGLRGTDIASLQFNNIDWTNDTINLIQSKTGYPVSLPLNAATGNSLFDYITKERPQSKNKTILLTSKRPHLKYEQIGSIVNKIFECAGVRMDGGTKGSRVFRHHFVTYLLTKGVACDVVSCLVGHQSPESLKPYADADIEHLKECSIDISSYPVNVKIFEL
jgi:site-specific recombinase XerD